MYLDNERLTVLSGNPFLTGGEEEGGTKDDEAAGVAVCWRLRTERRLIRVMFNKKDSTILLPFLSNAT